MNRDRQITTNRAAPVPSDIVTFDRKRHATQLDTEEEYDDQWPPRLPSSARRYYTPDVKGRSRVQAYPNQRIDIPPRRSAQQAAPETEQVVRRGRRFHMHPLLLLGLGAIIALLLYVTWWNANNWWIGVQEDWKYTSTFRTFSIDQVVGHNNDNNTHPSHFIVQNDKRHILIIELPADDEKKAIIYRAPVLLGADGDKTPLTISFQTDAQTGRLDMVLHVEDQSYVYVNNGTQFIAPAI